MDDAPDNAKPPAGSASEDRPLRGGGRSTAHTAVSRFAGSERKDISDVLALEEPLEMQLGYGPAGSRSVKSISVTMRTPGYDFELAAGFLLTEGIVREPDEIGSIRYVAGLARDRPEGRGDLVLAYQPERNVVRVELAPGVAVSLANLQRNFYTTSSCGICGKASLLALRSVCPPRARNGLQATPELLCSLPEKLRAGQAVFEQTGGLHASGLFSAEGLLLALREDVGRHNAVDKLIGGEFLADRVPLRDRILLLSGRASFELLQKALMGGIQMIASVGAPSSLAVEVARDFDITLIGFLRGNHFNVYHGTDRIQGPSE